MVKRVYVLAIYLGILTVGKSQSQQYGPPSSNLNTVKDTEPSAEYGPPSFVPGQPLGADEGCDDDHQCRNKDLERNKRFIMDFYQDCLGNKRVDLADKYIASDYRNHNPLAERQGRDDFKRLVSGPLQAVANQMINFKRVDAAGDVVWTHLSLDFGGKTYAVMDIFKIDCNGQIQEHWDVLQDTTLPTKNPVAFF